MKIKLSLEEYLNVIQTFINIGYYQGVTESGGTFDSCEGETEEEEDSEDSQIWLICPNCEGTVNSDDQFCKHCGHELW